MKYKLDKHSDKPSYMQLYSAIKNDIIDGIFRLGDKLPSKRTMADNIGASVITVEHAYSMLDEEGYIEARQRSGYYVIYNEKETYRSEIKHILNVKGA